MITSRSLETFKNLLNHQGFAFLEDHNKYMNIGGFGHQLEPIFWEV